MIRLQASADASSSAAAQSPRRASHPWAIITRLHNDDPAGSSFVVEGNVSELGAGHTRAEGIFPATCQKSYAAVEDLPERWDRPPSRRIL